MTNQQPIPIEKIFEMYGRVSFERDMLIQEIQALKMQIENKGNDIESKEQK